MTPRRHYMQDDKICRLLEDLSDGSKISEVNCPFALLYLSGLLNKAHLPAESM
jgi:hypothetical protein